MKRLTVNLAPADLRKAGPAYDLPIAIGLLLASEQVCGPVDARAVRRRAGAGRRAAPHRRRAADGQHRHAPRASRRSTCPFEDAAEAGAGRGRDGHPGADAGRPGGAPDRRATAAAVPRRGRSADEAEAIYPVDFQDIKGQEHVKRALEVAAAGGHNLLMCGPARRRQDADGPRGAVDPAADERWTRRWRSPRSTRSAGLLPGDTPLIRLRPFCAPHHTISQAGLVGGGRRSAPGEITPGAPRRAVPGRAARVRPADARGAAPAARGPRGHDQRAPAARSPSRPTSC